MFLTERELCAILRIASITARTWRRRGSGPPFTKIHGRIRYSAQELAAWVKSREQKTSE
jgi:predicted site-specific integrase-resolvase